MANNNRFPLYVVKRARNVIEEYRAHKKGADKLHRMHALKLNVDYRHRLISFDGGENWKLISRENAAHYY